MTLILTLKSAKEERFVLNEDSEIKSLISKLVSFLFKVLFFLYFLVFVSFSFRVRSLSSRFLFLLQSSNSQEQSKRKFTENVQTGKADFHSSFLLQIQGSGAWSPQAASLPSKSCQGSMVLSFCVQMGTGVSNKQELFAYLYLVRLSIERVTIFY